MYFKNTINIFLFCTFGIPFRPIEPSEVSNGTIALCAGPAAAAADNSSARRRRAECDYFFPAAQMVNWNISHFS